MGKLESLFQAALAVSAILGSLIAGWSFTWVVWLSVIPQILCLILSFKLTEPRVVSRKETNPYLHLKEAWRLFISNPKLRLLTLGSAIGAGAGEAIYLFNATFIATLWPVWAIGVQKALANVGAMVSFLTAGKLLKRFSTFPLLMAVRLYGRVTSLVAYGIPTVFSPLILATHSLFFGTITVAESALKQREFSAKQRATMGSLNSLAEALGIATLAYVVGFLGDKLGAIKALLLMQIFQMITIGLYWRLWKDEKN